MEDCNYNIHLGDGVREARYGKASAGWFGPKEESQRERWVLEGSESRCLEY